MDSMKWTVHYSEISHRLFSEYSNTPSTTLMYLIKGGSAMYKKSEKEAPIEFFSKLSIRSTTERLAGYASRTHLGQP